ncbi:CHAD domain-containing protein [Nakamurella panacisegetis]|uniref:CHAD domain-containing protein n=1 Tax=Nakamurella panacisegetis TaxID=1090615 RepID=A0A1H0HMD4_9ACTN|nr:CYTH and CHAD domain-containing protein [Nakamurella panacisegetis]SDO20322.1 CHAD domain-containing protein [Nakamurella panacisegetis]
MNSDQLDRADTYQVSPAARLPDLTGLKTVRSVATDPETELVEVFHDTQGLALLDAGITLRRRTDKAGPGWSLDRPWDADQRTKITAPLVRRNDSVPSVLAEWALAWTRGNLLSEVGTVTTRRSDHRLLGSDGAVLAILSDDHVTAHAAADGGSALLSEWREWHFALVDGGKKLRSAAEELLVSAGARPSDWPSTGHHAVGRRPRPMAAVPALDAKSRAGEVLLAYLREQVEVIVRRDHDVRVQDADAVHKVRVATRRLRSALATYRPLLHRDVTDPIRDEVAWFATALGGARDAYVQQDHLLQVIAAEPDDLILGPVAGRIQVELHADAAAAHEQLRDVMHSDRYFRLLDTLDDLVASPPFSRQADGRARKMLGLGVAKAIRRLVAVVALGAPAAGDERDWWLHDIRKAAKRVRYAAETSLPVLGRPAIELAATGEEIQELLGAHQDSVVLRKTLRAIGVRMHLDGENPFTIGRLHALQQVRADQVEVQFERAWRKEYRKRLESSD